MADIATRSGLMINLNKIDAANILLEDMAVGLNRIARFNGSTIGRKIWTIAQHSLAGSLIAKDMGLDEETQLAFVLHDGHEYVCGDIITPVADHIEPASHHLSNLKQRLDASVFKSVGIKRDWLDHTHQHVGEIDALLLYVEGCLFKGEHIVQAWRLPKPSDDHFALACRVIESMQFFAYETVDFDPLCERDRWPKCVDSDFYDRVTELISSVVQKHTAAPFPVPDTGGL